MPGSTSKRTFRVFYRQKVKYNVSFNLVYFCLQFLRVNRVVEGKPGTKRVNKTRKLRANRSGTRWASTLLAKFLTTFSMC